MYDSDPVVNDLVLTIIHDGDGTQCGRSYFQRLEMARTHDLFTFRMCCRIYGNQRVASGSSRPTTGQLARASDILLDYYVEHLTEL